MQVRALMLDHGTEELVNRRFSRDYRSPSPILNFGHESTLSRFVARQATACLLAPVGGASGRTLHRDNDSLLHVSGALFFFGSQENAQGFGNRRGAPRPILGYRIDQRVDELSQQTRNFRRRLPDGWSWPPAAGLLAAHTTVEKESEARDVFCRPWRGIKFRAIPPLLSAQALRSCFRAADSQGRGVEEMPGKAGVDETHGPSTAA